MCGNVPNLLMSVMETLGCSSYVSWSYFKVLALMVRKFKAQFVTCLKNISCWRWNLLLPHHNLSLFHAALEVVRLFSIYFHSLRGHVGVCVPVCLFYGNLICLYYIWPDMLWEESFSFLKIFSKEFFKYKKICSRHKICWPATTFFPWLSGWRWFFSCSVEPGGK